MSSSPGLMAIGEAACVSVHGANRLGSNSLIDLIVFGRAAAERAAEVVTPGAKQPELPADSADYALSRLDHFRYAKGGIADGRAAAAHAKGHAGQLRRLSHRRNAGRRLEAHS